MIIRPDLLVRAKYSKLNYLSSLIQLLPRGPGWRIPVPNEDDITPYSILSSQIFGLVTVIREESFITLIGIPSMETWGSASAGNQIQPNGILTSEAWGNPGVTVFLVLTSISSSESWNSPGIIQLPASPLQEGTFDSGLGAGWASPFTSNWSQDTDNEEGFAVRGSDGEDRMYPPTGTWITGDFELYFGIWLNTNDGGADKSIHIEIADAGGDIFNFNWNNDEIEESVSGALDPLVGSTLRPGSIHCKITRVSGDLWAYYWTGSAWKRMDAWDTPGSVVTDTDNVYIDVDGATYNGLSYMYIYGATV